MSLPGAGHLSGRTPAPDTKEPTPAMTTAPDAGLSLAFDADTLTIGDLIDFEEAAGASFADAFRAKRVRDDDGNVVLDDNGKPVTETNPDPKALLALVWIAQRKSDPGFTLDAARNVRIAELSVVFGDGDEDDTDRPT